jgi:hypothetical protein
VHGPLLVDQLAGSYSVLHYHLGLRMKGNKSSYQSLSYNTTTSAVVRLMPNPPARVVSRNMNLSEPGLLYSSMATIRSSCAVPPSIRQYSDGITHVKTEKEKEGQRTISSKQTIILQDIENATHLAEYKHTRSLRLHRFEEPIKDDHLSRIFDDMLVSRVWRTRFLERVITLA